MFWLLLAACSSTPAMSPADILAAADAHDGTVDKVVSECTGCGLGMPGDPAHSVTYEGYELHFCSDSCKSTFEADPVAGIERLEGAVSE